MRILTGPDSLEAAAKATYIFKFVRSEITMSMFTSNLKINFDYLVVILF